MEVSRRAQRSDTPLASARRRPRTQEATGAAATLPLPARAPHAHPHAEPHTSVSAALHSPICSSTNMHGRPEAQHFHSAFPCCTTSTCTPQPPPSPPHQPTSHTSSTHTPRPQHGPHRMWHANATPSRPDRHTIPNKCTSLQQHNTSLLLPLHCYPTTSHAHRDTTRTAQPA